MLNTELLYNQEISPLPYLAIHLLTQQLKRNEVLIYGTVQINDENIMLTKNKPLNNRLHIVWFHLANSEGPKKES